MRNRYKIILGGFIFIVFLITACEVQESDANLTNKIPESYEKFVSFQMDVDSDGAEETLTFYNNSNYESIITLETIDTTSRLNVLGTIISAQAVDLNDDGKLETMFESELGGTAQTTVTRVIAIESSEFQLKSVDDFLEIECPNYRLTENGLEIEAADIQQSYPLSKKLEETVLENTTIKTAEVVLQSENYSTIQVDGERHILYHAVLAVNRSINIIGEVTIKYTVTKGHVHLIQMDFEPLEME